MTQTDREILILKTQIKIDTLVQESIDREIDFHNGLLTQETYNTQVNENLTHIEELLILKESLQNDTYVLTLEDIQNLNLGSYIDDSSQIQNLPLLAYIQNKSGHIIVYNLNSSAKLGEINENLYP